MGKDKRGVDRGACSVDTCECEEYEVLHPSSIRCDWCNHTPLDNLKHSIKSIKLDNNHPRQPIVQHIEHRANDDNSDVSDNEHSINHYNSDVSDNEHSINNYNSDVSDNEHSINNYNSDVSDNEHSINNYNSDVSDNEHSINNYNSDVSDNEHSINNYNSDVSDNEHSINNYNSDVSDNGHSINNYNSDVSDNEHSINNYNSDVSDNEHNINNYNSDVSDKGNSCPEHTISTVSEPLNIDDTDDIECINRVDSKKDAQTKVLEGRCRSHQVKECNPLQYKISIINGSPFATCAVCELDVALGTFEKKISNLISHSLSANHHLTLLFHRSGEKAMISELQRMVDTKYLATVKINSAKSAFCKTYKKSITGQRNLMSNINSHAKSSKHSDLDEKIRKENKGMSKMSSFLSLLTHHRLPPCYHLLRAPISSEIYKDSPAI